MGIGTNEKIRKLDIRGNNIGRSAIKQLHKALDMATKRHRQQLDDICNKDNNTNTTSSSSSLLETSSTNESKVIKTVSIGFGIEEILLGGNKLGSSGAPLWQLASDNRMISWRHRQRKRAALLMACSMANTEKLTSQSSLIRAAIPLINIIISLTNDNLINPSPIHNNPSTSTMNPYTDFHTPFDLNLDALLDTNWAATHGINTNTKTKTKMKTAKTIN